ncbi:probable rRNA maturation factor [Caldanaerovirga acetigignens]|uniref:Endoribonuclease YbeY n=2 Tax=Caldanaerovirga acetigignens TaxID=447595 RepID=A0A1M7FPB3_9FIRM|nr:probable rRNA maturation factor [Caldanaerovirga acetigignens]
MNLDQVTINDMQDKIKVDQELQELIKKAVELTLDLEKADPKAEVSVALVDNAYIRQLNKIYRGKDEPTDVLSFSLGDESFIGGYEEIEHLLGDIVVSLEKAEEQANIYGHSFKREVVYLLVHGTLHLLGYDHENDEQRKVMREKEERILRALGLSREESGL